MQLRHHSQGRTPSYSGNPWLMIVRVFILFVFLISAVIPHGSISAQQTDAIRKAGMLIAKMTPEEKVGQLFLVTFDGTNISTESQIYDLVVKHAIGGVILRVDRNNFTANPSGDTPALIQGLQNLQWDAIQAQTTGDKANYVPLLIGMAQESDGSPTYSYLPEFSNIPNQLMTGATWNTQKANQAGIALAEELRKMGVNLLVGPSLDVLETPGLEGGDDLGIKSFGGDPYWVGQLGKAYISGLHTGSQNSLLVISQHFPGRGAADRPLEAEVATVRKSLEQLKQIELAPFFSVTGGTDPLATTDGLLVSHLRYQGFQGNIRATTRPVSLDSTALSQIMALPEFAAWREAGGLLVSDNLGSQAIRHFSDPTLQSFDPRQIARSAFLAGNDLLYVDQFAGTGDLDSYTGIVKTLEFFTQKYSQDAAFAERVDQSVLRILARKYEMYPQFTQTEISKTTEESPSSVPSNLDYSVAQEAATLIDPTPTELSTILPNPPTRDERITFLIDTQRVRLCAGCEETIFPAVDSFEKAVLNAFGPGAANQVISSRLSSYSFQHVQDWLNDINPPDNIATDLRNANWIVVGIQNLDAGRSSSGAFKRLLSEKPDLFRNKNVIVFALNAPYYLDATDLSKVTAYYGIYGRTQNCFSVAALILFQELTPQGASPVSIPGAGYDLLEATTPDPNQVISLVLDLPEKPLPTPSQPEITQTPEALPEFRIGDTLPIRTGVIVDHNGHPVPDGTVVRFLLSGGADLSGTQQMEATTVDGIARTSFRIVSKGLMQIHVVSEPAQTSNILQLDVPPDAAAVVVAVAPTGVPTPTLEPTPTLSASPTPTSNAGNSAENVKPPSWLWPVFMIILGLGTYIVYTMGYRMFSSRWGIRWALCALVAGISSYIYVVGGFPGGTSWYVLTGNAGILGIVVIFMAFGWAIGILWHSITRVNRQPF